MESWESVLCFPPEPDPLEPFGVAADGVKPEEFASFSGACALDKQRKARSPAKKRRRTVSRKPKKPRTGYNYFHLHEREAMMRSLVAQGFQSDKEAVNAEVNRRIAQKWKRMGQHDKKVHLERAEADKIRYEKELSEFHKSSSGSAESDELPSRCLPGTLHGLKTLAERLGIKRARVGWPICCPPSGSKGDIRRAVLNHIELQPTSRLLAAELKLLTSNLETSASPTHAESDCKEGSAVLENTDTVANTNPDEPLVRKQVVQTAKRKTTTCQNLMSMRTLGSRTWLLDIARHHNLLTEKSTPFLKIATDAIEKEMSLTMTRMSKRVLSIVANDTSIYPTTNIHALIKELNKRQEDFKVSTELVSLVNAIRTSDISRPQNLLRLTTGHVKGFFMLNKTVCDLLIREAKRCATHCELKLGQISVEALGLQEAMTRLALEIILPVVGSDTTVEYEVDGSIIYDGDKPLFEDFTFTADPADDWRIAGSERSLPNHIVCTPCKQYH